MSIRLENDWAAIAGAQTVAASKDPGQVVNKPPAASKTFLKERNWEAYIGSNIINKIGIGILVLGIGFYMKYAMDEGWISDIGRVILGMISGGLLIGIAHRIRKAYQGFSSVLVGGGMSVFYFTIAIAFHDYHLIGQLPAFLIMITITAFAVLLSITYDRKELAILSILGGFATPFMVSTGSGNYVVLFSYILTLNVGMMVLAYFKKWNILNILTFLFTIGLYGAWLLDRVIGVTDAPNLGALCFGTAFYLVFFVMHIINNVKENRKFEAFEIMLLISNTFLYYSAGMYVIHAMEPVDYKGLFTALLAVFNFIFAFSLFRNKNADRNLIFLLIGLVLTFLSLTAPVQLSGNHITLFWSAETVLLLWLYQKSGIKLIRLSSVIVLLLMVISLVMDWYQIYYDPAITDLSIVFNKGFITNLVALGALIGNIKLLQKEKAAIIPGLTPGFYRGILKVAVLLLAYGTLYLELRYQVRQYIGLEASRQIIIGCFNYLFLLELLILANREKYREWAYPASIIGFIGVLSYFFFYHIQVLQVREAYLMGQGAGIGDFMFHGLMVSAVAGIAWQCFRYVKTRFGLKAGETGIALWVLSFVGIFLLSAELDHVVLWVANNLGYSIREALVQNQKIGYPILWGVCSLFLMAIGMRKKLRSLRLISLTLFLIILVKLFLFDLVNITEGGRIAAFISLGVLLLIVSFMYHKLKRLIWESPEVPDEQVA